METQARVGVIGVLLCSALLAGDPIDDILSRAASGPAEATADILLSLLENNRVKDAKKRAEIIDDLLLASLRAKEPFSVTKYAPHLSRTSERDALMSLQDMRLDGLSIRCRAIRLLMKDNRAKARERFEETPPFPFPKEDCADPGVADVAEFYELGAALYGADYDEVVGRITSPVEVAPAIRALRELQLPAKPRARAMARLAERLTVVRGGNRYFYTAVRRMKLLEELTAMLSLAPPDDPVAGAFGVAAREFLRAHLTIPVCADIEATERVFKAFREDTKRIEELRKDPKIQINIRPDIAAEFNTKFLGRLKGMGYDAAPLPVGEKPEKTVEAKSAVESNPADWLALIRRIYAARSKPDLKLLDSVVAYEGRDEPFRLSYFLSKSGLFSSLLEMPDSPEMAEAIVRANVEYLSDQEFKRGFPNFWLHQVKYLVKRAQPLSEEAQTSYDRLIARGVSIPGMNKHVAAVVNRCLLDSRDPILGAYGRINELFPDQTRDWQ